MDPSALQLLPLPELRALLVGILVERLDAPCTTVVDQVRAAVEQCLERSSPGELRRCVSAYAEVGGSWGTWRADPLARRISRTYLAPLLEGGGIDGAASLAGIAGQPQVWVCNHLSYADTSATDALLAGAGLEAIADAVLAVAGPKVYTDPYRRLAALALNTVKTPQSRSVSAAGPDSLRALARAAAVSLESVGRWVAGDGPALLYAEGSRSRSGRLGRFLPAVHRYLRFPDLWVVPLALAGTAKLYGMDERMRPSPVRLRVGSPFEVASAGGSRAALALAHRSVAELLAAS